MIADQLEKFLQLWALKIDRGLEGKFNTCKNIALSLLAMGLLLREEE
jgi:hypothetical protein